MTDSTRPHASVQPLQAPFPYFGGKSVIAPRIWEAFGDVPNYVEPFFGSGAVLLARPDSHQWWDRTETVNNLDGVPLEDARRLWLTGRRERQEPGQLGTRGGLVQQSVYPADDAGRDDVRMMGVSRPWALVS